MHAKKCVLSNCTNLFQIAHDGGYDVLLIQEVMGSPKTSEKTAYDFLEAVNSHPYVILTQQRAH